LFQWVKRIFPTALSANGVRRHDALDFNVLNSFTFDA
jgi:hypothetical protein